MYGDKRPGSTLLHSCVNVEMHPSRMLQVSRISENLPVFPSKALRASSSSSARFFAGEWLIVVAGNKLFLWKYSRYVNTQPHSSCVSFDLPVSDLPHSASLVGLLFPSNDAEVSPLPTSCLALSSCGGNLRLWPRLTRNYVHVDTVLPAPIGGLYGDQAIQLEHIHVSGAFVAATRTGHLVLIDTRNAQDGVKTHLITSTNDGCMHSKGILSGLGRRVSNFFNLVSSTTNSGLIKSMPARGGENFVFLRLITCMSSNDCEKCFCFALYKNQLDVWSVDYNLNCELCDVYTIDKLINSSSSSSSLEDGDSDWEAVDFAIQSNRYASSTADQTLAYILLSRIDDQQSPRELRLLTVKFNRIESSLCFTINASVGVEYPFYEDRLYTSEETNIQFCLPADSTPQSLYPCLLGCLYCLRTGQVFIIEVLTGQIIGKLEFSPNLPNKPPCPQSLISIGSSDMHSLFIFLTCQCGLLTLTPCIDSGNNNAGTINEVMDAIPSSSGGISMIDVDQASLVSSEVSLNRSMHKSRSSIVSCPTILSQKHHSEPDFSIIVHTVDEKRLKVNTMFTANTYIISLVGESFDKPIKLSPMDRLFVALCEVARIYWMGFKEQTINYMKSILHDTSASSHLSLVYFRLAKRILNEHPISSDARWQWLHRQLSTIIDSMPISNLHYLELEGSSSFQYIVSALHNSNNSHIGDEGSTDATLLLPISRLCARLDALHNLQELWLLLYNICCEQSNRYLNTNFVTTVKLIDVPKYLNILLSTTSVNEDDTETTTTTTTTNSDGNRLKLRKTLTNNKSKNKLYHELRSLMNEHSFTTNIESYHRHHRSRRHSDGDNDIADDDDDVDAVVDNEGNDGDEMPAVMNTFPNSRYACCSPEYDQLVEDCAGRLLNSLDFESIIKAADDCPMDNSVNWAETHILCGLHIAGELIEFGKALQNKLAKEPQSLYQSVFNEVAMNAGFTSNHLQVIKSQDIVLQTVTLIPELIKTFCETIDNQISMNLTSSEGEIKSDTVINRSSVEFLIHVSRLIEAGVAEIVQYRETRLSSLLKTLESCNKMDESSRKVYYLPCWLTDEEPYGLGNVLLKLLNHLVKVGSNKSIMESETDHYHHMSNDEMISYHQLTNDCIKYAIDLIRSILCIAKQRVLWATVNSSWALYSNKENNLLDSHHVVELQHQQNNQTDIKNRIQAIQRLRRLKHWYASLREYLISIVGDQLHRPESALDLAEQFVDLDQIMRWCYLLEVQDERYSLGAGAGGDELTSIALGNEADQRNRYHHHRLAAVLKRVPREWKLPDYALQWFLSNGERSRVQSLLALLHRSNAVLNATEVHDTTNLNPSNISSSNNSDMMISHQVINNTSIINDKKPLNISVMKNTHHDLNQPHSIVDTSINNSMLGVTSKINQSMQHKVDPISYQRIECDDPVEKFLHRKDVQIHAWPHLMSTGQFEKAATVLYEEACKEFQFLGRRKNLFSLAKLTYLTSDQLNSMKNQSKSMFNKNQLINQSYDRMALQKDYEQDNQRCPLISKIDGYLKWISLQELLDQNHVKSESIFDNTSSDSDPRFKRVLSIPVLVRLYVNNAACLNETMKTGGSSGSSSNHNDNNGDREDDDDGDNDNQSNDKHLLSEMIMHFRRAFILIDILQIVSDLRPNDDCHDPIEARDELLLHIWCQAIRMDEWSTSGDVHDPIEICTRSFICALVSDLFKNGVNVISLLPSPDQLFAADELADLTKDPQFHYLIESGFEHMRNILTSQKDTQDIVMTDICGV